VDTSKVKDNSKQVTKRMDAPELMKNASFRFCVDAARGTRFVRRMGDK
jgi:hypothetical protein